MARQSRLPRGIGWFHRSPTGRDEIAAVARMQVTMVVYENGDRLLAVRNNGPETAIGVLVSTDDPAVLHDSPAACRTLRSIPVDDLGAGEERSFPLLVGSDESVPELFRLTWIDGAGYTSERFVVPSGWASPGADGQSGCRFRTRRSHVGDALGQVAQATGRATRTDTRAERLQPWTH